MTVSAMKTSHENPTCGCCESWIAHVEADGFTTSTTRACRSPAMPVGCSGTEQGEHFESYEVLLLTKGEPTVVAQVAKRLDQA